MKHLVIAGANGFLGRELIEFFQNANWKVTALVRNPKTIKGLAKTKIVPWDGNTVDSWTDAIEGADALINLCGKSVNCRYHKRNREAILRSRLDTTKILNTAAGRSLDPPKVWINASTATIYEHSIESPNTEQEGIIGKGFSVEVAQAWEREFFRLDFPDVRKIAIRTSMVLGHGKNSVYPILARLAKLGAGGKLSKGNQMKSWIHIEDFLRAVRFLIDEDDLAGVINLTAPAPVPNDVFMKILRLKLGIPFGLNHCRLLLEIAAFLMRTETELILKSRFAYPERLLKHRFIFTYPFVDEALEQLAKSETSTKMRKPLAISVPT